MSEQNYDQVICPECNLQFQAIPVNVQDRLRDQQAEIERLRDALHLIADPGDVTTAEELGYIALAALSTECEHEWGVRQGGYRKHCRKCGVFRVEETV